MYFKNHYLPFQEAIGIFFLRICIQNDLLIFNFLHEICTIFNYFTAHTLYYWNKTIVSER